MPRTDYSSTEVARIAGVTYRTLDRWLEDVVSCDVPAETQAAAAASSTATLSS